MDIDPTTVVLLAGLHSLAFAVFHAGFWRMLRWPSSLESAGASNRAVIQILNLRLLYVFLGIAALCFFFPNELVGTALGRALLLGMSGFWIGRTIEQFVFFRKAIFRSPRNTDRSFINALTVLFAIGAVLFALPVFI